MNMDLACAVKVVWPGDQALLLISLMVLFIKQVSILHSVPCVIFPVALWGRNHF